MKPVDTSISPNEPPQGTTGPAATAECVAQGVLGETPPYQRSSEAGAAEDRWSIGELAAQLGVSTRTIRFYEARRLIAPEREKGARIYDRRDRARMYLILRGKNLGFTLEDIREYLELYDADPDRVAQTQLFLQKVQASVADLERKKIDIERTLAELKVLEARAAAFLRDHG